MVTIDFVNKLSAVSYQHSVFPCFRLGEVSSEPWFEV